MPQPVITDKSELVIERCRRRQDGSKLTVYHCWVEGNARDEDELYSGSIDGTPSQHTPEQISAALEKVPNEHIFFPLPVPWYFARTHVTVADPFKTDDDEDLYVKRPWIGRLREGSEGQSPSAIAEWFACEVRALERLSRYLQHPNIVKYHGCRVRKGHVTGVLLGRVEGSTLWGHVRSGKTVDKEPFLAALTSAVEHLHNVIRVAHNDIQPFNIMVGPDGMPTLIDLGSAEVVGETLLDRPHSHWGEDPLDFETKTRRGPEGFPFLRSRDLASLNKLAVWLDHPVYPWSKFMRPITNSEDEVEVEDEVESREMAVR